FFFPSWHFHPECEIMLVTAGTGIRFAGDSIERFQPGDLVFFGPGISHLYRSDEEYYLENSPLISKATVLYFKENFPGEQFWNMPEMAAIKRLLMLSRRGIKFTGITRSILEKRILKLAHREEGIEKVMDLLQIMKVMATSDEYELLSGNSFTQTLDAGDCARINSVYQFILDNYTRNPSLEEVAKIACMSTTAFCRYFKTHTNKTYVQFLNEVKIGNASKMLIDNKLTISRICFETG